ncbi:MAG: hypothetical protein KDD73_16265 [Anaerolineales bacterium]|nr:hypothetical protein [Anaerolineales bacterium]
MSSLPIATTSHVTEMISAANRLSSAERLFVARWLLDSVLSAEMEEDANWQTLGLSAFAEDWDNEEDAIYDDWRAQYGLPAG